MPSQIELTLGELARIALGNTNLGPANIAVLHSLIDLLLKKLDCQNEKVVIGGYESNCLKKLLGCTSTPPYAFQSDNLEIVTEKIERIAALGKRVDEVQHRIEKHFNEIEECNKEGIGGAFEYQNWEHYAGTCEDLCFACEPENRIACQLVKNADFMKKMLRRISYPLIDRMFHFETRVEMLHNDFKKFMEKTSEHYVKMSLVERCIQEIEHLRHQVDDNHLQFLGAMEEVQDMFDAKLDKTHLPALRKYVRERFDVIENMVTLLRTKKSCPKPSGIVMDGIRCLSCGNKEVCTEKSILVKGVMPNAFVKTKSKISKKYCGCQSSPEGKLQISEFPMNFSLESFHVANINPSDNRTEICKHFENEYVLKEGTDGKLYRMILHDKSKDQKTTEFGDIKKVL